MQCGVLMTKLFTFRRYLHFQESQADHEITFISEMWSTTIMNESVRSNSKQSCAIVTIVEIISLQSRDNVIRFDDYVTTSMPDRDVTGHTKCINISQPFTKTINSFISILSINHTWHNGRLQRSTPSSRFLDSFHLPKVWRQKNHLRGCPSFTWWAIPVAPNDR